MNDQSSSPSSFSRSSFSFWSSFAGAWRFLTIVPLGRRREEISPWSPAWFAFVGTVLGWCLLLLHHFMRARVPLAVEAALLLVVLTALTGALHLDGLADASDGLYGSADRDERLRRMKDPYIGAMGMVVLTLTLLVKFTAFWSMAAHRDPLGFMVAPAWGRGMMALTMVMMPYLGTSTGTAIPFLGPTLKPAALAGAAWMVVVAFLILGKSAGWLVIVAGGAWWGAMWITRKRLGGITGDLIGAIGEVVETVSWVVIATLTCGRL